MPNAATFDDDLGYEPKPRKGAPRKPRAVAAGKKKGGKRKRFGMDRIARYAAIGMAATMALGIMVNALVLQKGHHPAPLFGKASSAASSQAAAAPASIHAEPVQASVESAPAAAAKVRKTVVATRDADAPSGDDAIGRLLAGGGAPSAKVAGKAQGKVDGKDLGKTVTGVQRALTKLGFKVPVTGAAGPATKKAIEAYEKDHHLPVKGEVNRHLVKVLAADSGIRID